MSDELVGQRSAHAFQQDGVVGVLEDTAMSLLLDVLQILARRPVRWILLAHITKAARELGELLAVGALSKPADLQMIRFDKGRAGEESDDWFSIEQGGFLERKEKTASCGLWAEQLGAASFLARRRCGAES